jgi:hypothetical protein
MLDKLDELYLSRRLGNSDSVTIAPLAKKGLAVALAVLGIILAILFPSIFRICRRLK